MDQPVGADAENKLIAILKVLSESGAGRRLRKRWLHSSSALSAISWNCWLT